MRRSATKSEGDVTATAAPAEPGAPASTTTLDRVPIGAKAEIVRVDGDRVLKRRLMEMGLVRGERVLVQRVAPLGDPIGLRVKGYGLALRRSEARSIQVRLAAD